MGRWNSRLDGSDPGPVGISCGYTQIVIVIVASTRYDGRVVTGPTEARQSGTGQWGWRRGNCNGAGELWTSAP